MSGHGHVRKRVHATKAGKESVLYYAVVELPRGADGKRKSDWGKGFRRKSEANDSLNEKLTQLRSGGLARESPETLEDFSAAWLLSIDGSIKATTFAGYRQHVLKYLIPRIGHLRLVEITPRYLDGFIQILRMEGGLRRSDVGSVGLADKTVRNIIGTLGVMLAYAVRMGELQSNPVDSVRKPSARRQREMVVWEASEVSEFLRGSVASQHLALFHLALHTGMRRGEVLGLRWDDIDVTTRRLSVRQTVVLVDGQIRLDTPKSNEARTIDLDPGTIEILERLRVRNCDGGVGVVKSGLVFSQPGGDPLRPDSVSQWFVAAVEAVDGCKRISFHQMRHTHATLLLKAGVPVHVVSQRLGHADVGFTMKTYVHVLPGMQADAAATFAALLESADEVHANASALQAV